MDRLVAVNLIRVFDFYLAVMLLFSLIRRWAVYRDGALLAVAMRTRWPNLLSRLNKHKAVLLDWAVVRPVALALGLTVTQMLASRAVWPQARVHIGDTFDPWWHGVLLVLAAAPMLLIDGYFLVRVGRFDRGETEKYFDMAEGWAGGWWKSRLVRTVTFGRINPDKMVDDQVRDGLGQLGATLSWSMWWVSYQIASRMLCGLTIWGVWAFG